MADSHQPFRLPQQSKRENPRLFLQNNHPQLFSTFQHAPVHQLHCPDQNPNPAGFVNSEGVHVVGPSSASFSFPSCGDHSLSSIHNAKDLDHRFSFGADAVSLSLAPHHRHQRCAPLELNAKRYDVVSARGGTPKPNNELRSSVPLGPFTGYASILKRSSFLSPAQQLLDDFCGVGRGVPIRRHLILRWKEVEPLKIRSVAAMAASISGRAPGSHRCSTRYGRGLNWFCFTLFGCWKRIHLNPKRKWPVHHTSLV
ncbi:BEL1-like homeodomain protein 9 [Vitis vinifera]|uniref:BEL1-like homeodomain protein 9 n=1 Tax=Vitis vinifera TaxID=29760 RepID=A0A438ENH7_VITVI|nr:BEL1-like homeodomain protein 9 [Vitis vinifera]